jgi:glycosyltransferase involved in cell wall biosynthesis
MASRKTTCPASTLPSSLPGQMVKAYAQMKVLIATPYYHPRVGGMENYSAAVAHGLHERGWEVVIVCGDTRVSAVTCETLNGYRIWRLPIWKVISNTPVHPGWFGMLRRIIRTERPDIVNAHTPVPYMVDMVTLAAGRVPVVATYHAATLFKPGGGLSMRLLTFAYQAVQSITLTRARAIIAVSPYVKSTLSKRLAAKTQVVPNSVSSVSTGHLTGGKGLVFVANLEPTHSWKGLDLILDSLAIARDKYGTIPQLTIIGDGADRARYEQRVRELDVEDSVRFEGLLVGSERDRLVRQAAAQVVYPTTANDGTPTVLLEGWAQGLPVIASAIGPISALVDDHNTGVLVAPNNAAALAAAIHEVLDNPTKALAMGEAARKLVAKEYTWPRQVDRTAQILEALI